MKQKQLRWLGLILILAGAMSLGLTACEKKESETPSDPGHIVLDDYEIQYKGFTVMPDVDGQSALVLTLDFTNNGKEATSYLWAVSEKVFLDGIGLDTATVLQGAGSKGTVTGAQLTEIMPGKTIEVKSAYRLPDGDKKALEAEGEEDFPMLLFPVIPVALSTEHKNFCGSVTVRPDTYYHLLYDICVSLAHHGFKKLAFLVCHGGNAPIAQVLSRELRSELGIAPFILSAGAFGHPDVKATISKGNIWDFHGGEMETSMVMAVDESLVKLELSEAGEPTAFEKTRALKPYGPVSIGWVSEDWKTKDGSPIGIGGDPSGASAEKGRIILETSARELVPGLLDIRDWNE